MKLGSPLRDIRAAALLVGALAALVYANSLGNGFAYDDVHIIRDNAQVQGLDLPLAISRPWWPEPYGRELALWRPVTSGVFSVLHALGGGSPLPFHVANVAGHVATSLLVLLLCAALMPLAAALVAALVFAVHPTHVEAVANAVGLAEVLSALAAVAACWVHLQGPERTGWGRALVVGALYAIAFGAKESGVTVPGLVLLVDAARRDLGLKDLVPYVRDRWRAYAVMGAVAAALLYARVQVLGGLSAPFGPLGGDLLAEIPRIWTLGEVWTHYVRLWVFPLDLSADYSPNVIPISVSWHATNTLGVGLVLVVLGTSLLLWRRGEMAPLQLSARTAAFGVVWFMIAISPVSNVVFLSGVILAERTLYLPTVGLAAATGWLVVRTYRDRPRAALTLALLALVLGAVRTWTRNPAWRDNKAVFDTMLAEVPHSGKSQWVIGDGFLAQGQVSQGLLSYRAAVNLLDSHYTLITAIAQQMVNLEDYRTAEVLAESAWRSTPTLSLAPSLLAWTRAQVGDAPGTELWARRSLALYARDPLRHYLLAWALAAQGRFDEARAAWRAAGGPVASGTWHHWMYWAYLRREARDSLGALAAVDSAWARVTTRAGRRALDSIRVAHFGLVPLLDSVARQAPLPRREIPGSEDLR
jgi:hypothetical protein